MNVTKRDGRTVVFDGVKIHNAILSAFNSIEKEKNEEYEAESDRSAVQIADSIASYIHDLDRDLSVEEIQDIVEQKLMESDRKDVAKSYIIYRNDRSRFREKYSDFMKEIGVKIRATDVQNQNANVDEHSFGGRAGEANAVLLKKYALDHCMSPMAKKNHEDNLVYIHDLDQFALGDHNCLSIPFDDVLKDGFDTRQTDVRPAQSVNSALQLVAVLFQLQSLQQFGGVAATHLDWTMVPYVRLSFYKHYRVSLKFLYEITRGITVSDEEIKRFNIDVKPRGPIASVIYKTKNAILSLFNKKNRKKDTQVTSLTTDEVRDISIDDNANTYTNKLVYKHAMDLTKKETHQATEALYHNLNTLQSRSGNQLPFTSINYGTCTLSEGRMVTKNILEVALEGNGKLHRTSIFPCGIFQYMKGVNAEPGTPNYDLKKLAIKCTCKRLYPNYVNVDWSTNAGYDRNDPRTYVSTMGCRTYNGFDINGLGQLKDGRGNICPVTVIMPTVAMETKEKYPDLDKDELFDKFLEELDKAIEDATQMLIERFNWIASQNPKSAKFMYENGLMAGYKPEEGIISALKHGTLALGQIGLAETLEILVGCNHVDPVGMEYARRIESLFKSRCAENKEKYKLNIGVYYTPAENLCFTAMKKFKEKYGVIKNVSDRDYFTNSMHVPVWEEVDPYQKIDIESQLTGYSNAGCITYVELDSSVRDNEEAVEDIIDYAMDKDIPYFAINIPNDTCNECGFTDEIEEKCPKCGSTSISRLRRVTGYLTGDYTTAFNPGKQREVEDRFKHSQIMNGWKHTNR